MINPSIIIPTCGHFLYAVSAVRSAVEHTPGCAVIVVDDASPDWSDEVAQELVEAAPKRVVLRRFHRRAGLTRSWNEGLRFSRAWRCRYTVCGNSDLMFTAGWWDRLRAALDEGAADFVGPVTNAPGHCPHQNVCRWLPGYNPSDSDSDLAEVARRLWRRFGGVARPADKLNGFCFAGRTETYWRHAFDGAHVFDPAIPLAGNEDDFFRRVRKRGGTLAFVPSSFVFHYRSVTRGGTASRLGAGAYRPPAENVLSGDRS